MDTFFVNTILVIAFKKLIKLQEGKNIYRGLKNIYIFIYTYYI